MDVKQFCRKHYARSVECNNWADRELLHSLKHNERVPKFIDNMAMEITKVQSLRRRQGKKPIKIETMAWCVKDMTDVFIRGVLADAMKMAESDIAKYQREHAQDDVKDMEDTLAGDAKGEFADMGLIVGDTKVESV